MISQRAAWARLFFIFLGLASNAILVRAHDTWIEAGPLVQPVGEYSYVHLMLGNHGNDHRDFKLASKITLTHCTLECTDPSGKRIDLKPQTIDMGYAPKEGFWAAKCDLPVPGTYELFHTLDTLHGKIRAVKSAKTYVIAREKDAQIEGFYPQPHHLGLELVLLTDLREAAAGRELRIRVLRSNKPLSNARVTFIPRGANLSAGFDSEHERMSDEEGIVRYTPNQGNVLLAVVHHIEPEEKGEGYDRTHYAASIVLPIRNQPITDR